MVLSAHDDIYGEIFRYLDKLELGDEVIIYAGEQPFHYLVMAKGGLEANRSTRPGADHQTGSHTHNLLPVHGQHPSRNRDGRVTMAYSCHNPGQRRRAAFKRILFDIERSQVTHGRKVGRDPSATCPREQDKVNRYVSPGPSARLRPKPSRWNFAKVIIM